MKIKRFCIGALRFRGINAAASLKQLPFSEQISFFRDSFRGINAAASLKRSPACPVTVCDTRFRGINAAASLKRVEVVE